MPRNGSGVYGPPGGSTVVPNTTIESAVQNSLVADLSEALSDSVNVDGTAPWQANQPMGSHKLTGLSAGSAATDSLTLGQAQSGIVSHATVVGGSGDAITATFSPVFTAYTAKMHFRFTAGAANTIAAPTVNVDSLGTKTIKKLNGAALAVGDIAGSGHVCYCVYDGTDVLLLNPATGTGNPIGKHTIWIPAGAMTARTTSGAAFLSLESSSNKVMRRVLAFDAATDEFAQFSVAMPKSWNAGTVTARMVWEHPATTTNFAVIWGIQGLSLTNDDACDTAFGTAVTVTDTGGTTSDLYKSDETSAITLSNTPAKSDTAIFQVYRDADPGGDTLAVDAYLIGVELFYTTDAANDA